MPTAFCTDLRVIWLRFRLNHFLISQSLLFCAHLPGGHLKLVELLHFFKYNCRDLIICDAKVLQSLVVSVRRWRLGEMGIYTCSARTSRRGVRFHRLIVSSYDGTCAFLRWLGGIAVRVSQLSRLSAPWKWSSRSSAGWVSGASMVSPRLPARAPALLDSGFTLWPHLTFIAPHSPVCRHSHTWGQGFNTWILGPQTFS